MTDLPPIRKSVDVPLPPREAFALFTDRMGDWWPGASHSGSAASGNTPKGIEVEPRAGGQIIETTHDGRRMAWARITDWAPGERFAFDWHVGRDEREATQVDVVFTRIEGGCRVDLTHDGFANWGSVAAARHADYTGGWDMVLAPYLTLAAECAVVRAGA